jgi:V8-like Glu-specific endopeptidase/fibronectin type 3 domain-containing protein
MEGFMVTKSRFYFSIFILGMLAYSLLAVTRGIYSQGNQGPSPGPIDIQSRRACYTLEVNILDGKGLKPRITPPNCPGGTYRSGTRVKLTARPAEGYRVHRWFGTVRDGLPSLTTEVIMTTDRVVSVSYHRDVDPNTPVAWGSPGGLDVFDPPPLHPGSVIPPDDGRVRIPTTTIDPYRKIAHLELTFGELGTGECTGWFIGPHTVITAGHCLYDHGLGWITEVRVIPARDGTSEPLGSQTVVATEENVISTDGWVNSGFSTHDYGAIILPDDTLGTLAGWFDYGYFSDSYLYSITNPTITGYPSDKLPEDTMWADVDDITALHYLMVLYEMDTYKGQSGSPVYHPESSSYIAVAVHAYGAPCFEEEMNCGPRINKDVADLFYSWGAASSPLTDCTEVTFPSLLSPAINARVADDPVLFDWTDVAFSDSYLFELYLNDFSNLAERAVVTDSLHTVSSLDPGTYFWQVRSQNISGCPPGEFSSDRAFTIEYASTPTNIQASDGAYTESIVITSDPVENANQYYLWRAPSEGGAWTDQGSSDTPYFSQSAGEVTANYTYYYRFHACNDYGCSAYSYHDPGWRAMPSPSNVEAGDLVYDEIPVTWDGVMDATFYQVYRSESVGGVKVLLDGPVSSLSYADTSAIPGITFYYWVKACNSYPNNGGCSDFSNYDTGERLMDQVPFVLASDGVYTQTTDIVWSPIPEATFYEVYRTINPGDPKKHLDSPIDTAFDDLTGEAGQVYHYFVRACNEYTCGTYMADTGWRAMPNPADFEASDGTHLDRVVLTWTGDQTADYFNVHRAQTVDGTRKLLGQPATPGFEDGPDDIGRVYHYWVEACNSHGCGATSYDTGWIGLSAPTGLTASDGTYTDKIHLYWNAVTGVTHYNVYRSETSDGEKLLLDEEIGHAFEDFTAIPGKIYYYWVKACYESNCSDFSSVNSGWRDMASLSEIKASDGDFLGWVRVSWAILPEASYYEIYRGTVVESPIFLDTTTEGIYDDLSALPGQIYYYWAKACTSYRCSDLSPHDTGYTPEYHRLYIPVVSK